MVVLILLFSITQSCPTLFSPVDCSTPGSLSFTISQSLLKLMSIESVMPSTISSSVIPLSCLQSFPSSGSFPVSQLFASGCQSLGASASVSASVFPMNIQDWFPLGFTGLISLQSKWLSRVFSCITIGKHPFFGAQPSLWSNFHIYTWLLEKPVLTIQTFESKVMSLLFNTLSRFVIAFLPRSKSLNSMAAATIRSDFGTREIIILSSLYCCLVWLWPTHTAYFLVWILLP